MIPGCVRLSFEANRHSVYMNFRSLILHYHHHEDGVMVARDIACWVTLMCVGVNLPYSWPYWRKVSYKCNFSFRHASHWTQPQTHSFQYTWESLMSSMFSVFCVITVLYTRNCLKEQVKLFSCGLPTCLHVHRTPWDTLQVFLCIPKFNPKPL